MLTGHVKIAQCRGFRADFQTKEWIAFSLTYLLTYLFILPFKLDLNTRKLAEQYTIWHAKPFHNNMDLTLVSHGPKVWTLCACVCDLQIWLCEFYVNMGLQWRHTSILYTYNTSFGVSEVLYVMYKQHVFTHLWRSCAASLFLGARSSRFLDNVPG